MMDVKKVIQGLENCPRLPFDLCYAECMDCDCPYYDESGIKKLHQDAVALLKEKEHSKTFIVIDSKTGEEADTYDIALHEDWAKHLCYCDMEGWAIEEDGTLLLVDECGRFAYADRERFKVKWDD